ncbi:hypothetical protein FTX61_07510 [Nitriliruptoraceae bacterium ZYF776]|nr:hypothetical protein [Profundirhabdus halotolerans]
MSSQVSRGPRGVDEPWTTTLRVHSGTSHTDVLPPRLAVVHHLSTFRPPSLRGADTGTVPSGARIVHRHAPDVHLWSPARPPSVRRVVHSYLWRLWKEEPAHGRRARVLMRLVSSWTWS